MIKVSVPAVVSLLGECGSIFGEPALAIAVDLELTIQACRAKYDFYIVDGYKMDSNKHMNFSTVVQKLWGGEPLEFSTNSQMPSIDCFSTGSVLTTGLTGLLSELKRRSIKGKKTDHKRISKAYMARQAFKIENSINKLTSPLQTSAAILGGGVLLDNSPDHSIWSIDTKNHTYHVHQIPKFKEISLVIGYPKQRLSFSSESPRPLFSSPAKSRSFGQGHGQGHEPVSSKLERLVSRSGFAKDNMREISRLARPGADALTSGDHEKLGQLMNEECNLLTILGLCPEEQKVLIDAGKKDSLGVTLTGINGHGVVAVTKDPEQVARNFRNAGGEAAIVESSEQGIKFDIGG